MRILVSGASGLVGSALLPRLTASGHEPVRLVRPPAASAEDAVLWDPPANHIDADRAGELDAVIHLAGDNLASGRWTEAKKRRIRESRVRGTRLLSETLAHAAHPPRVFLVASATGFYGNRGEEVLTEQSRPGAGFLAETCQSWEEATRPTRERGVRVVHLRLGVVLSRQGGALARLLPIFRLGLGGRMGGGRQYLSWVHLKDVVDIMQHCLGRNDLSGPVNAVAPMPVTNAEFTRALAQTLRRPAFCHVPAWILRWALGEIAGETLLASTRVDPARLRETGFEFQFPDLAGALRDLVA